METIILILAPIIAAILSLFVKRNQKYILKYIVVAAATIEFFAAAKIIMTVAEKGSYSLPPYFFVDSLGAMLLFIITIVGIAASLYSVGYLRAEAKKEIIGFSRIRQYFMLLHSFLFTMFFAVQVSNPILMWIAIEATTLSTAFLISFYGKPSSIEAAWKYLIINSIGLLLAFFGTLIFMASVSSPEASGGFATWKEILASASTLNPLTVKVAFIFVLIGYGTKMGLAPMHTWLPDAHSKAPAPISALLSGVLLNVAFYAILRFKMITDIAVNPEFSQNLLMLFGIISILFSGFIILVQINYKRLLAYSSIEHMGIIALGFGFGGVGIYASLLHMVYHALTKSMLFLTSGNIFLKYSTTKIYNVKGILIALPVTGILFFLGVLAITGMPPFGIFLTEFYILSAGISAHPGIVAAAIVGLVIVFIGFFKHATSMIFGSPSEEIHKGESNEWTLYPIFALAVILIVISMFIPSFLQTLINDSVKLLS